MALYRVVKYSIGFGEVRYAVVDKSTILLSSNQASTYSYATINELMHDIQEAYTLLGFRFRRRAVLSVESSVEVMHELSSSNEFRKLQEEYPEYFV